MRLLHPFNIHAAAVAVAVAAAFALAPAPAARADIYYAFDPSKPAGSIYAVSLAPGASVTLPVYLAFTGPDVTLLLDESGLFGADVHLLRAAPAPASPVGIPVPAAVTGNPQFDDPAGPLVTYATTGDVDLLQSVQALSANGVTGNLIPSGGGSRQILLGQFTFTAGSILGQVTTFHALDTPGFDDTVTLKNDIILDPRIGQATALFTVADPNTPGGGPGGGGNPVPVPGALAMAVVTLAVAATANTCRRCRRCRRRPTSPPAFHSVARSAIGTA
jgi:hypothetical protein